MVKIAGALIAFFLVVGFLTMSTTQKDAPRKTVMAPVVVCTKELKAGDKISEDSFQQLLQADVIDDMATQPAQVAGKYINCAYRVGDKIYLQNLIGDRSRVIVSAYRTRRKIEQGEVLNLSNVALDRAAIGELPSGYIFNCAQFNSKVAARDLGDYDFFAVGDMK